MKVPVRRLPQTRISEQQQGYGRAAPALNVTPITEAIEGFRNQLRDEQHDREKFEANKRLMTQINEDQLDFEARRRDPEISSVDFADTTNTAYQERHQTLLNELHNKGFDQDIIDDLDLKLGAVRQGLLERALAHQLAEGRSRSVEAIEDLGVQASQYGAANPLHGYASSRDMLRENIFRMPGLLQSEKEDLLDQQLGILRDASTKGLVIQNPQLIIDSFDPQGLTAPYHAPGAATGGTVNTQGLNAEQATVATVLSSGGLSAPVVAGFLGNFDVEGGYGTGLGDDGTASGIGQWREERRDNFKRKFGKEPHQATKEEQAQFVLWELNNPAQAGMTQAQANAIRNARTPEEAADLIDRYYERSSGEHRSRRTAAAAGFGSSIAPPPQNEVVEGSSLGPQVPQPVITGNLPLTIQHIVHNENGTVSTVRTISIGTDKGEVVIPTVIGGKVVSDEEATQHYKETGENFGTFKTVEEANAFAEALHQSHEAALPPQSIADAKTGNVLLDDLNGPERLQALAWAREQMNKVAASRKAEMDVTIGNVTAEALNNGGEIATPLPTEQDVLQVYGPVEGPQRWAQIQQSKDTGKAIQTFRTQSAESIQRSLDAIEPKPGSPTYATELQIYEAAQRAAQQLLTERQSDPAAYAMKYFPSVGRAAKKGTAQYYAELDRVYETLGIDSTHAPLLSAEATQRIIGDYKLMNPAQKLQFMKSNFAGMGEDRFRRFVSNMEGTTAQEDATIYALLRTYPYSNGESEMIYQQVLEGREAIAQDPARRPSAEKVNEQFRAEGLSAINNLNADASRAIQEMAAALYVMKGGDPKTISSKLYRESLATALGGSLPANLRHGQVKDYTILPPRVTRTAFQHWTEGLTAQRLTDMSVEGRRPRYGDLKTPVAVHDIIDEGVFVMVSPGRYMIKMGSDGRPIMTDSGRPFLVNISPEEVNGSHLRTARGTAMIR